MGNRVDGELNKRVVYSPIVPSGASMLPKTLPHGYQWVMRFYLESFQLSQLYCHELSEAEGWLSIRLKSPGIDGITRTFGWKADHHRGGNPAYVLENPSKFRRQLLYYGSLETLTYELFVVESDEGDRKAIQRVRAATELLASLAEKLPPPYNLSGDVLHVLSAASNVVELHIDDDLEMAAGGSLPTLQEIQRRLQGAAPDQIHRAGTFSVMQSTVDVDPAHPPQILSPDQIAKSVTFRIEFDQIPIKPQEWDLRVALTGVHIPNDLLENRVLGMRMNRHRNLILNVKLGVAGSSLPYSLEVPVKNGSATAARVVGIDPINGILLFNGKWNRLTEFFYDVALRLGKEGRVWLSDKLHYKERHLEEERKLYEALAKSTTKLIDSSLSTAKKHREDELKKEIKTTPPGPDRTRLEEELTALPSREWAPVNILRAGVTELPGIINEIIPDDKTLHTESGSFYLDAPPQGAEPLQCLPSDGWQQDYPEISSREVYLFPNQNLAADKLNSVQFTQPAADVFYVKLRLTRTVPTPNQDQPSGPSSSSQAHHSHHDHHGHHGHHSHKSSKSKKAIHE